LDASTNFDYLTDQTNNGKGLIFPRADLTTWSFKVNLLDGFTFPSAYDGMIVYNMATGNTPTAGNNSTVSTVVRPGYYIFSNPTGANTTSVSSGTWVRLNDAQITNIPSGSTLPNVSTSVTGDVFYHTTNGLEVFNGTAWVISGGGVSALATPTGSNANGGSISGTTLTLSLADATNPGLVSIGTQSFAGAKTFTSAITAPTSTNTINSLVINAGALSGITDYSQASGNFAMTGTGTFSTGTGAVSLNGATTAAGSLTVTGTAALNGNTTLATGKILTLTGLNSSLLKTNVSGVVSAAAAGTDYQMPITLTSTGTSGAATLSGNTLNIPQYAGSTYTAGTGLTLSSGAFSVNPSQNITSLSNLTSNGLVKTSGGTGALSVAVAGTDYQSPISLGTTVDATTANGATFASNVLTLGFATGSYPGLVSIAAQTFAGAKTFNSNVSVGGTLGVTGNQTNTGSISQTGTGTFSTGTGAISLNGATTAAGSLTVTGTTALNGNTTLATGKTLTLTGLNSSLLKTNASGVVSAAVAGTDYQSPISLGTTVDATTANGALLSSNTLTLGFATGSYPGLVSTATQSIAGAKTFTSAITAPTTTNTINSLIINAGALSGITGYTQASGNFAISGTGTFSTGSGAVTLNGAATAASSLTVTGTTALNGNTILATGKTLTLTGLNSSLLKTNASGVVSVAVAGTDYQSPISLGTTVDATTANGATFASNVLTLGFATGSYPGLVSTAAQTFAGAKIFSNNVSVGGTLGGTGATTLSSTLSVTGNQTNTGNFSQTGTGTFSTGTGVVSLNGNTTISGTNTLTVGTGATTLGGSLSVGGAASNDVAYNAGSATTIDFTQSNLAYTTASAGAFTLSGLKDGGTYTLAVQGTTTGTASFTQSGMTFKSTNNGATTSGYQTVYTFIVMGTTVYFWMNSGF